MIDPMADLDGGVSGAGQAGGTGTGGDFSTIGGEGKDIFDVPSVQLNMKRMDKVRSFMGIVSGCVAGVLGLTGIEGFGE